MKEWIKNSIDKGFSDWPMAMFWFSAGFITFLVGVVFKIIIDFFAKL